MKSPKSVLKPQKKNELAGLIAIMERLRGPDGCPWDREQSFESILPFIVEEAYEVISAVDAGTPEMLKEELGDLLFQIVFMCQLAKERGQFDIYDVMTASSEKMIRRHPHVFNGAKAETSKEVLKNWEKIKKEEKKGNKKNGFLSDIPDRLPALLKAHKVTEKASRVGFDWSNIDQVFAKVREETREFREALKHGDKGRVEDEFGDMIFALVNVGRFVGINSEEALRKTVVRFISRFHYIEDRLIENGISLDEASVIEMERLWNKAKAEEKKQRLHRVKKMSS